MAEARTMRLPRVACCMAGLIFSVLWGGHEVLLASSGFSLADEAARRGVQYRTHDIEGLRVLEVVVGRVDFEARLPVLLQLHGRGDRARLPEGSYENVETPIRILIPQAARPLGEGFSWAPVSVTDRRPVVLGSALAREASRLVRVLRHVESMREVVGRPIVTGFSQGAMLTYTLAVRHPEAVSAALPMAGWIPPQLVPATPHREFIAPIFALHGTADPIVRIGPTRVATRRLRGLGFEVRLEEFPGVQHEVSAGMRERHRDVLRHLLRQLMGADGPAA